MTKGKSRRSLPKIPDYGFRNKFFSIPFELRVGIMILLTTLSGIPILYLTTATIHTPIAYFEIGLFILMNILTIAVPIYENFLLDKELAKKKLLENTQNANTFGDLKA